MTMLTKNKKKLPYFAYTAIAIEVIKTVYDFIKKSIGYFVG